MNNPIVTLKFLFDIKIFHIPTITHRNTYCMVIVLL
jgi:hypothetical protein